MVGMFTFLLPPPENSLMELGNTFWLWGVLIVPRSVERNLESRVSKKKKKKNRPKPPVMTTNFDFVF